MWCSLIAWTHVRVFLTFVYQLVFYTNKTVHSVVGCRFSARIFIRQYALLRPERCTTTHTTRRCVTLWCCVTSSAHKYLLNWNLAHYKLDCYYYQAKWTLFEAENKLKWKLEVLNHKNQQKKLDRKSVQPTRKLSAPAHGPIWMSRKVAVN